MFFIKAIAWLPLWFFYLLADIIYGYTYYVARYRTKVVEDNLSNCFPEKSPAELKQIKKKFYKNFSQVLVENIKAYSFSKREWKRHMNLHNKQAVLKYLEAGIPVILMSGHTGNWEWPAFGVGVQLGFPIEFMYKPVETRYVDRLLLKMRSKHGGTPIPKDDVVKHILKRRKKARAIGMISDQLPSISTEKYWSQFLNRETAFYTGAERIAKLTGYAVFYGENIRVKKGKYHLTFHEIASPPYPKDKKGIIETFVRHLEKTIREHPESWLWSHRRWKYTKKEAEVFAKVTHDN